MIAILVTHSLLFQARMYWYEKDETEISEWKALNMLQAYWQRFLLQKEEMEIEQWNILSLLKKHGRKNRKKGKETALGILKSLGIWK